MLAFFFEVDVEVVSRRLQLEVIDLRGETK
jgi:hypothetical protein